MKAESQHEVLLLLTILSNNVLELMLHLGSVNDRVGDNVCHDLLRVIRDMRNIIEEREEVIENEFKF